MSFHSVTVSNSVEHFISISLFTSIHLPSMSVFLEREIYFKELTQIVEARKVKTCGLATQRRTDVVAKPSAGSTPSSSGNISLFPMKTFN